MIKTVIVDDEPHCADRLSRLLHAHCPAVSVPTIFHTVEEGITGIAQLQPELVFLDVMIHDQTGFDLLKQLPQANFHLVFTTAYEKYALQAFKFSALDYLLKPIDPDDLVLCMERVQKTMRKDELADRLDALFHNLKRGQADKRRITIPTVSGLTFVQVSDIIRCQSEINYTVLYLKSDQKITVAKTLKEFEDLLSGYDFYRVHNSHLVNMAYVKSYNRGKGGYVCMCDNSVIEVASRRKEDFLKRLAG